MNKLSKCIKFQSRIMMKSTLYFVLIYAAIYLFIVLMLLRLISSSQNSSGSMNAGFYIGAAIFTFVQVIAGYKSSFNFLLMLGNTRKSIFLSSVTAFSALSAVLAVISVVFEQVDGILAKTILSSYNIANGNNILDLMYKTNINAASEFLWYTTLFIMICSFSQLYGSLSYKFGKVFTIAFWVGFGFLWTGVPALVGTGGGIDLVNAAKMFFCTGAAGGILMAPVNFIIASVIFCAAAYALSIRQPQAA